MPNAIAVMAVSDRGSMYDPSAVFYMDKLVTGPEAADAVDIRLPVKENIRRVAKAKGEDVEDVTVGLHHGVGVAPARSAMATVSARSGPAMTMWS